MKKDFKFLFFLFFLICSYSENIAKNNIKKFLNFDAKKNNNKKVNKFRKRENKLIFNYDNEDLVNIINQLAAIKSLNIIYPQPPAKISAKVTFSLDKINIDRAWNLTNTILDLAGYSLIEKENMYEIIRNENVVREPLPVYVNAIEKLPNTDEKIRYIYFFNNISISEPNNNSHNNLEQILKDMLPLENEGGSYYFDNQTNSLVISGKSNTIKGIMRIIEELDTAGFPEIIEVIPLAHTRADFISKIIKQLLPSEQEPQFRYGPFPTKAKTGTYFSEQTKIIPIDRTNSLAILGITDSVQRVKDFIIKNLDQPIQSEKSMIHVKTLQYLDADTLAPVIQNSVKAKLGVAQAEVVTEKDTLANAVIVAEKLVQAATINPTITPQGSATPTPSSSNAPVIGGNRIIVGARYHDWLIISKLIEELDQPQLQVAIEVLVTDLAITDNHVLGAQIRNMLNSLELSTANFQAANITAPWFNFVNDTAPNITAQGLASDLQKLTKASNIPNILPSPTDPNALVNIPKIVSDPLTGSPGTTIFTFQNGNGISTILQLLDQYTSATILSQPFVITKNNQQANISIARELLTQGPVDTSSTGGPVIRKIVPLKADLTVNILPRISKTWEVNLEILINVNDFITPDDPNVITTRQVRTNANLKNKEVLVLGGLTRVDTTDNVNETPLLGKIPILGSLFRNKSQTIAKRDLMIFIAPTIIKPRLQGGTDTYTQSKINYTKDEIEIAESDLLGTNFEKLRDPITRVFFPPLANQINSTLDYYTQQKAYIESSKQTLAKNNLKKNKNYRNDKFVSNIDNKNILNRAERIKNLVKYDENPLRRTSSR